MSKEKAKSAIFLKLKKIKHIEIIIAVLFIAIILLIYFISFPSEKSSADDYTSPLSNTTFASYAKENEERLKKLVSGIRGAGNAEVMINYESTPELVIAYVENNTESKNGDTTSTTSNKSPSLISGGGGQSPIVLKEVAPRVIGVLIIAEGAGNPTVKLEILNAVSVLLGIGTDKIAVLEKSK